MVKTMKREELKAKLDRGDDFKLVMTMHESHFHAEHIPGSTWIDSMEKAARSLRPEDEIVVYCSDPACFASRMAATHLEKAGYEHVYHYEGGLRQWAEAGYPLEGTRWGERNA